MSALVHAIPITAERTGRPVVLIGGLAVICRLDSPYRATTDVDTVNRRRGVEPSQLDLLIRSGARKDGPVGALVKTPAGTVRVDVLEVSDSDLNPLPEDPSDRLHVLAHEWAEASATPMLLNADDLEPVKVRIAEPGPLVAMKLQSLPNRPSDKEATDLLDISKLMLDRSTAARREISISRSHTTNPRRCTPPRRAVVPAERGNLGKPDAPHPRRPRYNPRGRPVSRGIVKCNTSLGTTAASALYKDVVRQRNSQTIGSTDLVLATGLDTPTIPPLPMLSLCRASIGRAAAPRRWPSWG